MANFQKSAKHLFNNWRFIFESNSQMINQNIINKTKLITLLHTCDKVNTTNVKIGIIIKQKYDVTARFVGRFVFY